MLLTDGNVYIKQNIYNISLSLSDNDNYLIKEFIKEIKCDKTLTNDNRGCSEIAVRSKKMAEDLSVYGIIPQKSLKQKFITTDIDDNLLCHFFRGIMDGNGSYSFYPRKDRKVHTKAIRLCSGTYVFLKDVTRFLDQKLKLSHKPKIRQEKEHLFSIAYRNNNDMLKILSFIYSDATIYMLRKKETADKIIKEIREYRDKRKV